MLICTFLKNLIVNVIHCLTLTEFMVNKKAVLPFFYLILKDRARPYVVIKAVLLKKGITPWIIMA
jgi:hypothetical protein